MQPWPFCTQPANSGAPGTGDTKLIVSVRSNQAQAQAVQVLLCEPAPVVPSKVGTPAVLAACFNRSQSGTKRPSWPTLHLATQPTPETWHPNQGCCLPCNVVIVFPEAIYSTISDGYLLHLPCRCQPPPQDPSIWDTADLSLCLRTHGIRELRWHWSSILV